MVSDRYPSARAVLAALVVLLLGAGPAAGAADAPGDEVVDLHVWSIGPGVRAAAIVLVSDDPAAPEVYKARIPSELRLGHVTLEVHRRAPRG